MNYTFFAIFDLKLTLQNPSQFNNNNNNNNNTYIAPISILLFSSALKNKNISKKNYHDCIKYTCIKCMNLPKRVKTILSTLKL